MYEARYEIFDHTADLGMRVYAPTLPALLWPATLGLYAMAGELTAQTSIARTLTVKLADRDPANLLRDYLNEVLFMLSEDSLIGSKVVVDQFNSGNLIANLEMHEIDRAQSNFFREIKAITYHELGIVESSLGFLATVIVDI